MIGSKASFISHLKAFSNENKFKISADGIKLKQKHVSYLDEQFNFIVISIQI